MKTEAKHCHLCKIELTLYEKILNEHTCLLCSRYFENYYCKSIRKNMRLIENK